MKFLACIAGLLSLTAPNYDNYSKAKEDIKLFEAPETTRHLQHNVASAFGILHPKDMRFCKDARIIQDYIKSQLPKEERNKNEEYQHAQHVYHELRCHRTEIHDL